MAEYVGGDQDRDYVPTEQLPESDDWHSDPSVGDVFDDPGEVNAWAGFTRDPGSSLSFPVTADNPIPGGSSQGTSHTAWDWWADTLTGGSDVGGVGDPDQESSADVGGGLNRDADTSVSESGWTGEIDTEVQLTEDIGMGDVPWRVLGGVAIIGAGLWLLGPVLRLTNTLSGG